MEFEKKKIQSETLSEYLSAVRQNLGAPLEEVSRQTGIKLFALQALENGNFKVLPAEVYVAGFLRQLAKFYAVDSADLINQYKKEQGIAVHIINQKARGNISFPKKIFQRLVITPKILTISLGTLFVAATVGYIIWQVWSINKTPSLHINSPANNQTIQGSSVEVDGKTDPGMTVSVNGQNIFVNSDGSFSTELALSQGPVEVMVTAQNHFGKSVSDTINLIASQNQAAASQVVLKLDFTGSVNLGYVIDGQNQQTASFKAGDSKTLSGGEEILLSTSDAGATKVTLNGQSLGVMGRSGEHLSNISFFASSGGVSTSTSGSTK